MFSLWAEAGKDVAWPNRLRNPQLMGCPGEFEVFLEVDKQFFLFTNGCNKWKQQKCISRAAWHQSCSFSTKKTVATEHPLRVFSVERLITPWWEKVPRTKSASCFNYCKFKEMYVRIWVYIQYVIISDKCGLSEWAILQILMTDQVKVQQRSCTFLPLWICWMMSSD